MSGVSSILGPARTRPRPRSVPTAGHRLSDRSARCGPSGAGHSSTHTEAGSTRSRSEGRRTTTCATPHLGDCLVTINPDAQILGKARRAAHRALASASPASILNRYIEAAVKPDIP